MANSTYPKNVVEPARRPAAGKKFLVTPSLLDRAFAGKLASQDPTSSTPHSTKFLSYEFHNK